MKKVLLISLVILISILTVFAYETIIIKYPSGENWGKAYYKKLGNEAILQYVPKGQSNRDWKRCIIVHSYYDNSYPLRVFATNEINNMSITNPTGNYKYIRFTDNDFIASRCTNEYKQKNGNIIKAQCEIYRVTTVHNGIISLHYINRNKDEFSKNYAEWVDIVKKAKYYNSYYRDERTFDKAEYFELW